MNIEMITGFLRHLLTFGGGFLVTNGTLAQSDMDAAVGAAVTLFGLVWSLLAKSDKTPIV